MIKLTDWVIKTEGLSLKAGRRYLLKDIDWQVKRGENWLVFGMNGSGKTTLLSILAGFKQGNGGRVEVLGERYTSDNVLALRRRIGWVSSSFFDQLYSRESVLDIVLSGKFGTVGLGGEVSDQDIVRAKALLKDLGMTDKMRRPFHLLSKGERQNVLIARALFPNPDILVLDEPSSGLDVMAREHLLNTVRDLAEHTQVTIIYVTHYTEEILDIFQHTLLLRKGQVYAQGRTEEMFTEPMISEFLGYPVTIKRQDGQFQIQMEACSRVKELLEGREA